MPHSSSIVAKLVARLLAYMHAFDVVTTYVAVTEWSSEKKMRTINSIGKVMTNAYAGALLFPVDCDMA